MAQGKITFGGKMFNTMDEAVAYMNEQSAALEAREKALAEKSVAQEPENCAMKLDGSVLTIVIDLAKRGGPSSTGKTITVGSTHGNRKFQVGGQQVHVGINAFVKPNNK